MAFGIRTGMIPLKKYIISPETGYISRPKYRTDKKNDAQIQGMISKNLHNDAG